MLFVALTVAVLAVSTAGPMAKLAAAAGAPALVIAAGRMVFSTVFSVPLLLGGGAAAPAAQREWTLAAGGGALLALHFATWIESLDHTSIAASTVLVSTSPLFGAIWASLFLGERVSRRQVLGIAVAVLGAGGILLDHQGASGLLGNGLALIGGAAAGGYWVVGRALRRSLSLGHYVTRVYAIAALWLLVAVVVAGQPVFAYDAEVWLLLALLAMGPGLLGHTLLNWSLRWLTAPLVSVLTLGEPIGAAILAALLPAIAEVPGPWTLIGGCIALIGIGVALTGKMR